MATKGKTTKSVVLHVGSQKTGTTAIQRFFADHYSDADRDLYYPKTGRIPEGAHRLLYDELSGERNGNLVQSLIDEIDAANAATILISSEAFSFMADESFDALRAFARHAAENSWSVTMLCVVRRALPFLRSLYLEGLNWAWTEEFDQFVQLHLPTLRTELLRDAAVSFGWASRFIAYDRHDLFRRFIGALDAPIAYPEIQQVENVSTPAWLGPFLLDVNRRYGKPELAQVLRDLALQHLGPSPRRSDAEELFALSPETKRQVDEIERSDGVRVGVFGDMPTASSLSAAS